MILLSTRQKSDITFMASILLAPPAVEPLSLAEAKVFLRLETADDDPLIAAFISAARLHVETLTGLAFVTQRWRMVLDCWPANGRIAVRPAPLQALIAARVFDFDGEVRTIDAQAFVPDASTSTLSFIPWALPMRRATCRSRSARRSGSWSRTGTRTARSLPARRWRRCHRMLRR
jgi:uncharacterized phiE125 gp8 family phage protein